jgi:hypothetical protein
MEHKSKTHHKLKKIKTRFHKLLSADRKSQIMRDVILENHKQKMYRGMP